MWKWEIKPPGRSGLLLLGCLSTTLTLTACTVGPRYQRPAIAVPANFKDLESWKVAQPSDDQPRGPWWEVFDDTALNDLAAQVNVSNQNLAAAQARLQAARATTVAAQTAFFPTMTNHWGISVSQPSSNRGNNAGGVRADYQLPVDLAYEPDVWGRIRHNVNASKATAQATAADLETMRLTLHAELAINYFAMSGLDSQKQLFDLTITAFEKAVELTTNRYNQGVASRLEVMQAQTQLEAARAQRIDLGVERAQHEHAIAVLMGQMPSEFRLPEAPLASQPPAIPVGVPSQLLERRPDIAAAERRVAVANAQIGIAQAAFFPTITLNSSLGLASADLTTLFSGPSLLWSLGSSLAHIAFDAGRRKALSEEARASYEATVAAYRQTVLTAFQNVEDNLAALRLLEAEAVQQAKVVQTTETALLLAINRYKSGVSTYLEVITAQSAALTAARTAVQIQTRRMTAAVLLVKALGGNWWATSL